MRSLTMQRSLCGTIRLNQEPQLQLWQQRGAWTTQLSRVRIRCPCPCSPSIFLASHHLGPYNLQRLHRLFIGGVRDATCHKLCGSAHHVATGRFHQSPQEKLMTSLPGSTSHDTRMAEAGGTIVRRAPHAANARKRGSVEHTRGGGGTPDRGALVGGSSMAMSLGPAACCKQEQGMIRRRTKQGNTRRRVGIETNTSGHGNGKEAE